MIDGIISIAFYSLLPISFAAISACFKTNYGDYDS